MSWIYIKETHFPQKFPNCLIEKMKKNDPQKISISHPIFYTCLGREKLMATHTIILKSSQSTWVLGQMQFLQTFGHLHHISWLNRIYVHPSCSKKKISQFAKNLAQFSKTSPICYTSFHLKKILVLIYHALQIKNSWFTKSLVENYKPYVVEVVLHFKVCNNSCDLRTSSLTPPYLGY